MILMIVASFILFGVTTTLICRRKIANFIKNRIAYSKLPQVPHLAFPLYGHTYLLPSDTADFFKYLTEQASMMINDRKLKFWLQWMGPVPLITVAHPDIVKVLLKSSKHLEKTFSYRFLHPWLGTGLLTSGGKKWHQRRRLITPTFHFKILQDFVAVMNEQCDRMLKIVDDKVSSGVQVDIGNAVTLCALDIICETAMGQTVNAQSNKDSNYVKAIIRMSEIVQQRQKYPQFGWEYAFNMTKLGEEQNINLNILHGFTRSVIEKGLKSKDEKKISRRMAFLDVLIHAKTEEGDALSLSDIQEEVDTFMFEGHDTIATTITWCLYILGCHPDVQQRVCKEIDDVCGDNNVLTINDIKKLEYLEQVTKEALRIYPSVPVIAREISENCYLGGYMVPNGTQSIIFVYSLHKNPEFWKDPNSFNPDRFSKENSAGRHPYAYIPFSAGPRNCVGQKFAQLEEKLILAKLLRRYKVTSHDKEGDIKMHGDLLLRPSKPLNITLSKRL